MIKPQLTSSAEAAFSKLSFKSKPNDRLLYWQRALYSYSLKNKTIKNYYNNPISNLQLGKDGFCFIQNENILNLIQSKEHCQVYFQREKKRKVGRKSLLKNQQKNYFNLFGIKSNEKLE
jgi:hypothetical protein